MVKKIIHISIILSITLTNCIFAQSEKDSSSVVLAWSLSDDFSKINLEKTDTLIYNFEIVNPLELKSVHFQNTGNLYSPFNDGVFIQRLKNNDFFHFNAIKPYLFTSENTFYYNTRKPVTIIKYTSAGVESNKEDYISLLHTQNITKNANFGFKYNLIASKGIFTDQNLRNNSGRLFGNYFGENYTFYTSLNINKYVNRENGGITKDELIVADSLSKDRKIVTTIFNNPEDIGNNYATNTFKHKEYFVLQKYRFGTELSDSALKSLNLEVSHVFSYSTSSKQYYHNSGIKYYDNYYYSNELTNDSVVFKKLSNTIRIEFNESKKYNVAVRFDLTNEMLYYGFYHPIAEETQYESVINSGLTNDQLDTYLDYYAISDVYGVDFKKKYKESNYFVNTAIYNKLPRKWDWIMQGKYYVAGNKLGDILLRSELFRIVRKDSLASLYLDVSYNLTTPGYLYKNYYSNNHIWSDKSFVKENTFKIIAELGFPKFYTYFRFSQQNIINYVCFNQDLEPQQFDFISVNALEARKHLIWHYFHVSAHGIIQRSTDQSIIKLPLLAAKGSIYFSFPIIFKATKGRLDNIIGVKARYNTEYAADMYDPSLMVYYHQQDGEDLIKVGGVPYFDAFLNIKLKSVRFLVKYENLHIQQSNNKNYYLTPNYPHNPGVFKLGISWSFNN